MDRIPPQTILSELAEMHGLVHSTGRINFAAFSRYAGMVERTVKRIAIGQTKEISDRIARQLMDAFAINERQAKGYESLTQKKTSVPKKRSDQELLELFRQLPGHEKSEIQAYLRIRAKGLSLSEVVRHLEASV